MLDPATRSAIGKWLRSACSTDASRPILHGVIHAPDGCCYSTDGHRVHWAAGLSDGSGKVRCPHSTVWLDDEDTPDIAVAIASCTSGDLSVTCDGLGLLACLEGVLKASKRAGAAKQPPCVLSFEQRKGRIVVGMSHGDFSAGIVLRQCAFAGDWGPAVAKTVKASYLVDALKGMLDVDGEAQVEVVTGGSDTEALYIRLVPNVVTQGMFALILPIVSEGDEAGQGIQEAIAGLAGQDRPRSRMPEQLPLEAE